MRCFYLILENKALNFNNLEGTNQQHFNTIRF